MQLFTIPRLRALYTRVTNSNRNFGRKVIIVQSNSCIFCEGANAGSPPPSAATARFYPCSIVREYLIDIATTFSSDAKTMADLKLVILGNNGLDTTRNI